MVVDFDLESLIQYAANAGLKRRNQSFRQRKSKSRLSLSPIAKTPRTALHSFNLLQNYFCIDLQKYFGYLPNQNAGSSLFYCSGAATMPSCICADLGTSLSTSEHHPPARNEQSFGFHLLTTLLIQARRQYAQDFSEKDKVAKFHGKKGSDVRLLDLR